MSDSASITDWLSTGFSGAALVVSALSILYARTALAKGDHAIEVNRLSILITIYQDAIEQIDEWLKGVPASRDKAQASLSEWLGNPEGSASLNGLQEYYVSIRTILKRLGLSHFHLVGEEVADRRNALREKFEGALWDSQSYFEPALGKQVSTSTLLPDADPVKAFTALDAEVNHIENQMRSALALRLAEARKLIVEKQ